MVTAAAYSPQQIAAWLGQLVAPDQLVELRALHLPASETRAARDAISEYHPGDQLLHMATQALAYEQEGAKGVYFVLNPVRHDMARARTSTRKADVLLRRWLLIDVDPDRPADTSATDAEHLAAWTMIDEIRRVLLAEGLGTPLVADSGNGWHLLLSIWLPNDERSQALCKAFLRALAARCNVAGVAHVGIECHDAPRICRLYGTLSRKGEGTPERPHRRSSFHGLMGTEPAPPWPSADACAAQIAAVLARWANADRLRAGRPQGDTSSYAKAALKKEAEAVAAEPANGHNRNNRLNQAAHSLGTLVAAGLLTEGDVVAQLTAAGEACGLEAGEIATTLRSGLAAGEKKPRAVPEPSRNGHGTLQLTEEARLPVVAADQLCTMHDLARAGAEISWLWEGWLQRNVVNVIGSEAGTGKTRFTLDLVRRIAHGLPWPDGTLMTLSSHERTLWVLADNHHDEMVTISRAWGIMDHVLAATTKDRPYEGTSLEDAEDLARLEAIVKAARPLFLVIDTVGNSTSRKPHTSEDAQAYYQPLQVIARRNELAILALTHLNMAGGMLGRRVIEKARSVLKMDKPDPTQENRRRLEVYKSNSKKPPSLGITMGDAGNEYDDQPPAQDAAGRVSPRVKEISDWLSRQLQPGPKRVSVLRTLAEQAGFNANLLYKGKESLGLEEFSAEGKKWWRLVDEQDVLPF